MKKSEKNQTITEVPKMPDEHFLILLLLTNLSQIKMKALRKDVKLRFSFLSETHRVVVRMIVTTVMLSSCPRHHTVSLTTVTSSHTVLSTSHDQSLTHSSPHPTASPLQPAIHS